MNRPLNFAFLDLVSVRYGPAAPDFEAVLSELDSISSETDFDLFLWSLARRLQVDTEELLRQLGESWLKGASRCESALDPQSVETLQALDWLLSESVILQSAPLPGMAEFRAAVLSRCPNALRTTCVGPRRCCSFLEGVARCLAAERGESLRYLRQPRSAALADLLFKTFAGPAA